MGLGDNYMRLVLTCGMGEQCINKENPGCHYSDDSFADAEECVTGIRPLRPMAARPQDFPDLSK